MSKPILTADIPPPQTTPGISFVSRQIPAIWAKFFGKIFGFSGHQKNWLLKM